MSKTIKGVPDSISRADYTGLIESVGFEARYLSSLTFHPNSIEAEVFSSRPDGSRIVADCGTKYERHHISIPVIDADEEGQA